MTEKNCWCGSPIKEGAICCNDCRRHFLRTDEPSAVADIMYWGKVDKAAAVMILEKMKDEVKRLQSEQAGILSLLIQLFAGKLVRISHTNTINKPMRTICDVCVTVHATSGWYDSFDIELESGHRRLGFVPEVMTPSSVEGELRGLGGVGGRRKIEVI